MATSAPEPGSETLRRLASTDPPQWLAPTAELSAAARAASRHLFSALKPYASKSPFERLLTEGFDAEQIWQQIDLQSQPLLSSLRREVRRFEKDPSEIRKLRVSEEEGGERRDKMETETEGFEEELEEFDEELDDEEDDEEDEDEENEDGEEGEDDEGDNNGVGIEDKFLKIKDLEEFLEDDEDREYGLENKKKKNDDTKKKVEEEEEDDDDDEDEDDELGEFGLDDGEEEDEQLGNARYEDFFGGKMKKHSKGKSKPLGDSDDSGIDDDEQDDDKNRKTLSTHEKELKKLKSKIEQMEQENMEPKTWTMQGEVTAAKRPKNSALEVDLDFEHNVRPPPVITEEVTASLEDMIKNRILEGLFDDVEKPPLLPSKAPREVKELDENKSKKGLAEIYEEDYVQKTSLASAPLSFAEEEKKEASMLFKKLCLKLDALSHFNFAPKPFIEDMSIPANVPALAMEEIAPLAVSDAAMLAPEEVFTGKGDIKEEAELTQEDRKRRRANKKRKFKAETAKRVANKPRESLLPINNEDEEAKMTKKSRDST